MTSHHKKNNNHIIIIIVIIAIIITIIAGIALVVYFVHKKKKNTTKSPHNGNSSGGNNNSSCKWSPYSSSTILIIQNGSDCLASTPNGTIIMSPTCSPQTQTTSSGNTNSWVYYKDSFANVLNEFYIGISGSNLISKSSPTNWTYCPTTKTIGNSNGQCWVNNSGSIGLSNCPTSDPPANMTWTFNTIETNLPSVPFNIQESESPYDCIIPTGQKFNGSEPNVMFATCTSQPIWQNIGGAITTSQQPNTTLRVSGKSVFLMSPSNYENTYGLWAYNNKWKSIGIINVDPCLYPSVSNEVPIPIVDECFKKTMRGQWPITISPTKVNIVT